jgi:hypothetical protein
LCASAGREAGRPGDDNRRRERAEPPSGEAVVAHKGNRPDLAVRSALAEDAEEEHFRGNARLQLGLAFANIGADVRLLAFVPRSARARGTPQGRRMVGIELGRWTIR